MSVVYVVERELSTSADVMTFLKESVTVTETCLTSVAFAVETVSLKVLVTVMGTF
jgi:hypothetical protein